MSREANRTSMMLFIGRPELNARWHERDFPTRNIARQERHRIRHHQVHTYPVAPFFDAQAARRLLSTTDCSQLRLFVSFLELDHRQCATILDGITTLLVNLPGQVELHFQLEFEFGNPEHHEAVQKARVIARLHGSVLFSLPNTHIEATSKMSVKGDDGLLNEED